MKRRQYLGLLAGGGALSSVGAWYFNRTTSRDEPTGKGSRPWRGKGSKITVQHRVTDSDKEYVEANDSVRYIAAYEYSNRSTSGGDSPPAKSARYDTVPFSEWAKDECAAVGEKRIERVVPQRLESDSPSIEAGVMHYEGQQIVIVELPPMPEEETTISEPPNQSQNTPPTNELRRAIDATPQTVIGTIELDGHQQQCQIPVYVRHRAPTVLVEEVQV